MKFSLLPVIIVALLVLASANAKDVGDAAAAAAGEEEIIGGRIRVTKYPIEDTLQKMLKPPAGKRPGPEHMQYIVGLDQSNSMVPEPSSKDIGLRNADPEYLITLSAGLGGISEGDNDNDQFLNRCYGGGWVLFDVDSKKLKNDRRSKLTYTGKRFLKKISKNDDDCTLKFSWNDDFTKADISGYFKPLFGSIAEFLARRTTGITIELLPYWKWKFGLNVSQKDAELASKLDARCCPPKKGDESSSSSSCFGPNVLGKEGQCETISMACGAVDKNDFESCAMYKRENYFRGLFGRKIKFPRGFRGYLVFPVADKYGNPTPYYQHYLNGVKSNGVDKVFHGIERVQTKNDEF